MTKRALVIVTVALLAHAAAQDATLSPDQQDALSEIDTVPTQNQLNHAFGSAAASELVAIAQQSSDYGVRLRAIAALPQYCNPQPCEDSDPAHVALQQLVAANQTAQSGSDLLILRAAIESLGLMRDPNDVGTLDNLLNHSSRDVRATTALALRDLCNTYAISALRTRQQFETSDQVRLAISAALRVLSAPPPLPCQ